MGVIGGSWDYPRL